LRTVKRDSFNTRALSRLLTPFAFSSRIVVRCVWLSMSRFLFLSDSCRHPVEFPARAFDLAFRLFLLRAGHLRQGFGQSPAGSMQDGNRHLQIALEFAGSRCCGRRLPLGFQEQIRRGENALANYARTRAQAA